ncbi:MAG: SDR family NAD(P)-dependent oxidoreductase [candidate division Zixibacteria bacterium]
MKKVLVTGANGFVGSHICEAFIEAGYSVRAMVRESSDLANIKELDMQLAKGDLDNPESLEAAVSDMDIVINSAGLTKTLDPREFERVNIGGTENILRTIESVNPDLKRFIQISSTAAVGPSDSQIPICENRPCKPLTAYGRSKLGGEKMALSFKNRFPLTILRPSAVYGSRDKEMLSFFKAIKFGIKPTFGKGECYSSFSYVKDLAQATVKATESETSSGSIYFIAEKKYYSYSEAGDIISEELGVRAIDIHVPVSMIVFAGRISELIAKIRNKPSIFTADKALEISQKYWIIDTSKTEKDIGFTAPTSFKDGVRETVEWYRSHRWL